MSICSYTAKKSLSSNFFQNNKTSGKADCALNRLFNFSLQILTETFFVPINKYVTSYNLYLRRNAVDLSVNCTLLCAFARCSGNEPRLSVCPSFCLYDSTQNCWTSLYEIWHGRNAIGAYHRIVLSVSYIR